MNDLPSPHPSHHGSTVLFLTEFSSMPVLQPFGKHTHCYLLLLPLLRISGTTSNAETPLRLYSKAQPIYHRIMEWFVLKGTLKLFQFQPPATGTGRDTFH